jgi:hypothetical protein
LRARTRNLLGFAGLLAGCLFAGSAPAGDGGPVIAIPGRPDVPVIINGVDASYAVVYGDWGLKRPGAGDIIIAGGMPAYPGVWPGGYYPMTGRKPVYGRKEHEPPPGRSLPPPAPTYYRTWSAESPPVPATEYPAFEPPQVIVAPPDKQKSRKSP